jgi:hypothetical protein
VGAVVVVSMLGEQQVQQLPFPYVETKSEGSLHNSKLENIAAAIPRKPPSGRCHEKKEHHCGLECTTKKI